jgi:CubicO group peptidase (beta-lactamase class C family)
MSLHRPVNRLVSLSVDTFSRRGLFMESMIFFRRTYHGVIRPCLGMLSAVVCMLSAVHADLSSQALRDAADYSAGRRGLSLLVIQQGKTVFEEYPNGGSPQSAQKIYSGTKTFFTMSALVAAQEGLLRLDEPVSQTISEWRDDSQRSKITIRELLNFSDGLDPAFHLHSDKVTDRNSQALRTPVVAKKGSVFTYGPSHGQVLCELLRRKLAPQGETPFGYLRHKVLDPLGLGEVPYRADSVGNPLVASGFRLTARQWSRFGLLVLGNGRIDSREIIKQDWFSQCFQSTRINPMFGLGFWMNSAAGDGVSECDIEKMLEKKWQDQDWRNRCVCRSAPKDLVAAVGSGYQRLFIIPSLKLVIVRQGEDAAFSDAEFLRRILK